MGLEVGCGVKHPMGVEGEYITTKVMVNIANVCMV
jgi:hypothetical protein